VLKKLILTLAFLSFLPQASGLQAQGWDYSLIMSIRNASGSLGNKSGLNDSEIFNGFSGGFQATNNQWLLGVNFSQHPGRAFIISTIPHTNNTGSAVSAAGTYENRLRKNTVEGFDFNVGYKFNTGILPQGYYSFVGIRGQRYKYETVDLGSREVWASTTSLTSTATIEELPKLTKINLNPMLGIGFDYNNRYFGQLTFVQSTFGFAKMSTAAFPGGSKSGMITELSFGIKF
jgi:hypothetical protein